MGGRFIWCFAGLLLSLNGVVGALEGPRGFLSDVDPVAWAIVFLAGALAWFVLAISAAMGRF